MFCLQTWDFSVQWQGQQWVLKAARAGMWETALLGSCSHPACCGQPRSTMEMISISKCMSLATTINRTWARQTICPFGKALSAANFVNRPKGLVWIVTAAHWPIKATGESATICSKCFIQRGCTLGVPPGTDLPNTTNTNLKSFPRLIPGDFTEDLGNVTKTNNTHACAHAYFQFWILYSLDHFSFYFPHQQLFSSPVFASGLSLVFSPPSMSFASLPLLLLIFCDPCQIFPTK